MLARAPEKLSSPSSTLTPTVVPPHLRTPHRDPIVFDALSLLAVGAEVDFNTYDDVTLWIGRPTDALFIS